MKNKSLLIYSLGITVFGVLLFVSGLLVGGNILDGFMGSQKENSGLQDTLFNVGALFTLVGLLFVTVTGLSLIANTIRDLLAKKD